jgi:hypothetical protein
MKCQAAIREKPFLKALGNVERDLRPQPCADVEREQNTVHGNDPAPKMIGILLRLVLHELLEGSLKLAHLV